MPKREPAPKCDDCTGQMRWVHGGPKARRWKEARCPFCGRHYPCIYLPLAKEATNA